MRVSTTKPKKSKSKRRLVLVGLVACGLATTWQLHRTASSRADWFRNLTGGGGGDDGGAKLVDSAAIARRVVGEGRLVARAGAEVTVGAEIAGKITRVAVEEKAVVHRGDVIAEIDCEEQLAAVAEAEARIGEVDADIRYFEPKLARAKDMSATGAVSVVEVEQWTRDLEAARARRVAAVATLRRLQIVVAKAQVRAPIDGTVIGRFANAGQMIEPSGRIVTISDLSQARLEVEISEFDGDGLVVGAQAVVTAEGYPGKRWRARVEEIPDVVAGRQLRPQDPGRPSDTGVLLVKLAFIDPAPFKLGQRVDATIELAPRGATADVATIR
jgi:RND family efflux transporter MFP subunit